MTVNVIKYKLHMIRLRIELEEKEAGRSIFKCTNCSRVYTELDLKDIFMTMECTVCHSEVKEEIKPFRNLMNLFNTQFAMIFKLLRKVENIKLTNIVEKPKPVHLDSLLKRIPSLEEIKPEVPVKIKEKSKKRNYS